MRYSKLFMYSMFFMYQSSVMIGEEKLKILYIDLDYVYEQSDLKVRSQKEVGRKRKSLDNIRKEAEVSLQKDKKYLNRLESLLGYEEYVREYKQLYQEKFERKRKEFEKLSKELEFWRREKELDLFEELLLAVETIAEKENATIVLRKKGSIVYINPSLDISDQVIDLLNEVNQRASITVK